MTAFYMFRLYFLTFEGQFRGDDEALQAELMEAAGKSVDAEHAHHAGQSCMSRLGR